MGGSSVHNTSNRGQQSGWESLPQPIFHASHDAGRPYPWICTGQHGRLNTTSNPSSLLATEHMVQGTRLPCCNPAQKRVSRNSNIGLRLCAEGNQQNWAQPVRFIVVFHRLP